MKRKQASEILAESFRELAAEKNINHITVKDISDDCGYAPSTFYRCYRNIADLIVTDYRCRMKRQMEASAGKYDWYQMHLELARFHWDNKTYFVNLLMHMHGQEEYFRNTGRIYIELLTDLFLQKTGGRKPDTIQELSIRQYSLGVVFLHRQWLLDVFRAAPEDIAQSCTQMLPAFLSDLF